MRWAVFFLVSAQLFSAVAKAEPSEFQTESNKSGCIIRQATKMVLAYQKITLMLLNTFLAMPHGHRIYARPGYETLYKNWVRDREVCAPYAPEEEIYRVDVRMAEIDEVTRP